MSIRPPDNPGMRAEEQALLERLVGELSPRLRAYVRRAFPAIPDADDIVAEAVVRAAARIEAWRGRERPELYLFTIVRNLCRDQHRRAAFQNRPEERFPAQAADSGAPAAMAEFREQHERVRAAVSELPEHQREIIVLRYSAGLKFEEIARLLEIPLGTALSRGNAALARLRQKLESTNDSSADTQLPRSAPGTAQGKRSRAVRG